MRRGIVYVGGAGRDLMDQSAALVADRIARSLQENLQQPFSYRIRVETDAYCLAPDIGLDIASIEIAKDNTWQPAIDILEVKYLTRFTKRFAKLPPLSRALKAFWLLIRGIQGFVQGAIESGRSRAQRQGAPSRFDQVQTVWLTLVTLASIASMVYWLVVGLTVVLSISVFKVHFGDILGDILSIVKPGGAAAVAKNVWWLIAIAVFLVLAEAFLERMKSIMPLPSAIESFTVMEYRLKDHRFLATHNAILDAIDFATKRDYEKVDLLSFSLGALLATNTIFPRRARKQVRTPPLAPLAAIDNWITLGHPYNLTRRFHPRYFTERQPAVVNFCRWINVIVQDDFLGTPFTKDDGIRVTGCPNVYMPHLQNKLEPKVKKGWRDLCKLRRAINHYIYWDDEDARAPTCFADIVDAKMAGWTSDVLAVMNKP